MTLSLLFNQPSPNGSNAEGEMLLVTQAASSAREETRAEAVLSIDAIASSSTGLASAAESTLVFATEGTSGIGAAGTPADARPGLGRGPERRRQRATFATVERGIDLSPLFFIRRSNSDTGLDVDTQAQSTVSLETRHAGVLQFVTSGSTELGAVPDDELAIALLMAVA